MRVSAIAMKIKNKKEEEISDADNSFNGTFLLLFLILFLGSTVYMIVEYGNGLLPEAASAHGEDIDWLFNINWVIVLNRFLFNEWFIVHFCL